MNEFELMKLFDKYQKQECTAEEQRLVEDFLSSFQKDNEWDESIHGNVPETEDRILQKIESSIHEENQLPRHRKLITVSHLLVAASVSVLLLVGILAYNNNTVSIPEKPEIADITRSTERGQKYSIVLADGTKVRLNSESTLVFPEKFTGNEREVELIGEAFFEVTKNPNKPFRVKTKRLTTEVLGTSFNVSAIDEREASVTVATGKVKVKAVQHKDNLSDNGVVLLPNQQVILDPYSSYLKKTNVQLDKIISWKDDIILFDHISFEEAAGILERWYNVTITFDKPDLKKCTILRSSYKNETLENVLKSLKFIQGIDYRFVNSKEVVISGNICKN